MIEERYFIEPALWSVDEEELRAIRTRVFIEEQHVPEAEEWDEADATADHVLVRLRDGGAIGTGRLTPQGVIGRLAVLREWRRHGVGEAMLQHLLDRARERGIHHLVMHAQLHAIPLYERHGFRQVGPVFEECGIEHQRMELDLPATEPPAPRFATPSLASSRARRLHSERAGDLLDATLELLQSAEHELAIYTRDLEAPLYGDARCLAAIKQVAISGRRARVRILVQDPARVVREGHRLLDLAHRLPSVISLRQPALEERQYPSAFVINDTGGYLFRSFGDRNEAEGDLCYPPRRDELARYFDHVWEHAETPPELRRLSL